MKLRDVVGNLILSLSGLCVVIALGLIALSPGSAMDFSILRGLSIAAAISGSIGVVWSLWNTSSRIHYRATASVFAVTVIAVITFGAVSWIDDREVRTTTILYPGDKPTPTVRNCKPAPDAPAVIGGGLSWSSLPEMTLLAFKNDEPFIAVQRNADGTLVISKLLVLDANDVAIVQKDDPETDLWVHEGYRWYKPNASTLIVNGVDGAQILKLEFLNKVAISVTGKFYTRSGFPVEISPNEVRLNGSPVSVGMCSGNVKIAIEVEG